MKLNKILALLALGSMPTAFGSIYVSDFTSVNVGDILDGVDGWVQTPANNNDDGDPDGSPLSWINMHDGSKAGALGATYDVPGSGTSFRVDHSLNNPLIGSTLSMDFGLNDSTNSFPDRNDFAIRLLNAGGTDLFSLNFVATSQTSTPEAETDFQWNMTWSSNGNTSSAFAGVLEGGAYTYDVSFDLGVNNPEATFTVTNNSGSVYSDTVELTGISQTETISDLRVVTDMGSGSDWGDNFIAFRGVPEPGAAMLILLSAVGFLRRRR